MKSVAIAYREPIILTRGQIAELYGDEICFLDGFDDCIVGVVERCQGLTVVCYDKRKIIGKLMDDGMSMDDAEEFFEYNQLNLWTGETTPCFITQLQNRY